MHKPLCTYSLVFLMYFMVIWCMSFYFLQEERRYILQSTAGNKNTQKVPFPPLKKIFTSLPFIGLVLTHIGNNWGYFIIATEVPSYLNNIQHVSLKIVSNISVSLSNQLYRDRMLLYLWKAWAVPFGVKFYSKVKVN